jgi:hypothetical protein
MQVKISCRGFLQQYSVGKQWFSLLSDVREYWGSYGGSRAFLGSPVLWGAFVLNLLSFPSWWDERWSDAAISILPNLLGLSIGAMAVILAFPTTRMFRFLAEDGRRDSFYIEIASRLTHFIVIQVAAIIFALLGRAYRFLPISAFGCWILIYAILSAAAIAFSLFGVARIYNHPGAHNDLDKR